MDLTDRGVEGRDPPKPLDVFLTTERGIYRAGETVYATALVRDATASAVENVPLTAIVTRPDGKEHSRVTLRTRASAATSRRSTSSADAMRGTWRIGIYADVKGSPLAETTFLVEDFEPGAPRLRHRDERRGDRSRRARRAWHRRALPLRRAGRQPRHRGRDGADRRARRSTGYPGYKFGLAEENFEPTSSRSPARPPTMPATRSLPITLPDAGATSLPLTATMNVRVLDTSGRPVERSSRCRSQSKPAASASSRSSTARPARMPGRLRGDRARRAARARPRTISAGRSTRSAPTSSGTAPTAAGTTRRWRRRAASPTARSTSPPTARRRSRPRSNGAATGWRSRATPATLPASYDFEAGWYVAAKALDTPEALKVSLDKERYAVGDTARVHIESRFNGVALVMVVDDRLIATKSVEVTGNAADIDLDVTRDWGPGAYVTAALYRPMDIEAKRMPGRAIGLAWAGVDPGDRDLNVAIDAPDEMRPRQTMEVGLTLANLPANRGLRDARRRRSRHPQSHPLQDARAGDLVFRPAPARHRDPRPLRPADRPHAGRARRGALRRRRRPRAAPGAAADGDARRLLFRHRRGRSRRHRARLRADSRLQRHRPPDGDGLDQGGRRPRREGRAACAIRSW